MTDKGRQDLPDARQAHRVEQVCAALLHLGHAAGRVYQEMRAEGLSTREALHLAEALVWACVETYDYSFLPQQGEEGHHHG